MKPGPTSSNHADLSLESRLGAWIDMVTLRLYATLFGGNLTAFLKVLKHLRDWPG